jgi:aspartate carbamoyltransferase regulatory subunit
MNNQKERILDHLKSGKTLTRINSFELLGVIETPARISELRSKGHDIKTTMITVKNRFGENVRIAKWSMKSVA